MCLNNINGHLRFFTKIKLIDILDSFTHLWVQNLAFVCMSKKISINGPNQDNWELSGGGIIRGNIKSLGCAPPSTMASNPKPKYRSTKRYFCRVGKWWCLNQDKTKSVVARNWQWCFEWRCCCLLNNKNKNHCSFLTQSWKSTHHFPFLVPFLLLLLLQRSNQFHQMQLFSLVLVLLLELLADTFCVGPKSLTLLLWSSLALFLDP